MSSGPETLESAMFAGSIMDRKRRTDAALIHENYLSYVPGSETVVEWRGKLELKKITVRLALLG